MKWYDYLFAFLTANMLGAAIFGIAAGQYIFIVDVIITAFFWFTYETIRKGEYGSD